jgi:esterase/lipase superfamily enzyme
MAPDVDAALFRELAVSMKSTSDQITLYASSKDGALIASKLFAGYTRAGQGGSELIVMPGVLQSIDASEVDTSLLGLNHSYFADNGTILSDLYRLFRDDPAEQRFGLTEATGAAGKYWIFAARAR